MKKNNEQERHAIAMMMGGTYEPLYNFIQVVNRNVTPHVKYYDAVTLLELEPYLVHRRLRHNKRTRK